MIKLLIWGVIAYSVYSFYLKPKLNIGQKKNNSTDEDYVIVKIPKKKKKITKDDFSDYEEIE